MSNVYSLLDVNQNTDRLDVKKGVLVVGFLLGKSRRDVERVVDWRAEDIPRHAGSGYDIRTDAKWSGREKALLAATFSSGLYSYIVFWVSDGDGTPVVDCRSATSALQIELERPSIN